MLLYDNKYLIANLGDSRIVAYFKNEKIVNFDSNHKPDDLEEKKRIEEAGGKVINGRINK